MADGPEVGSAQRTRANADTRCVFRTRSWPFGPDVQLETASNSLTSPVIPAAGSAWPTHALMPPTAVGGTKTLRPLRTAEASEPASIGSPRAVPVPWASTLTISSALNLPVRMAARSRDCCASPLGAVRLAERPSCRTALPARCASSLPVDGAAASDTDTQASPRT